MLRNLVKETATNPGSGTSISLGGAPSGYVSFIMGFGSGGSGFYAITDGTQTEIQSGTVTAGSPNTLSRGTPIWTSSGSTSRLTFTGAVSVYCVQPADRTLYADASAVWQAQARRMTGLAAGTAISDAPRFDQVAWKFISDTTWNTTTGGAVVAIPSGFVRCRLEWQDLSPVAAAQPYIRWSQDGGTTFLQGATDYLTLWTVSTGASVTSATTSTTYGPVGATGTTGTQGYFEFSTYAAKWGIFDAVSTTPVSRISGAMTCAVSGIPTHVQLAFVSQSSTQGRVRLLGT